MSVDNIKVAIKARPLLKREKDNKLSCQWKIKDNSIQLIERETEPFHFDHIFDENTTNQELFELVAKPIVDATLKGFNGTIFAYGQTSSGKTYTMIGEDNNVGVIDLAAKEIFKEIEVATDRAFLLRVGYIEIYNEKIYDLLDKKNDLKIHENANGEVNVNCTEFIITCKAQIMEYLHAGNKSRKIGETNMNERSSRSHAIFRIIIESREMKNANDDDAVQISYLNLVDLAGSERADQTGATGSRLKEGGHINKSLLSLSLVIKQLSENESDKFINYRNSKLTRILQASLGGNALTAIICTITPTAIEETYSTLSFALRAKTIKNKPKVNEILSDAAMMKKLEKEIVRLQKELELERQRKGNIKELENQIKAQELKFIRSNYAGVKAKDRRKTWCPMSTITEENPKMLCAQRRESFVSPSKPPTFLTPMVNTHRGFIDETPPFICTLTPDGEIFHVPDDGNAFKEKALRISITPERDLERRCKQLEQELEELKAFTDVERNLEVKHDTTIMLDEKLKEVQKEKLLYEEKHFHLKLLQEQMDEKSLEFDEYKNRCKILESAMSKLEEQVKMLSSKETDYLRQLEELQQKNKNLTDLANDAESFKYMYEEKLKRAKVRENDLLVLLGEKDAKISNMERNVSLHKNNVLIDKNIATEIALNVKADVCFCGLHETHTKLMEDFNKISEENQILKTKVVSLEKVDEEKTSLEREIESLKLSLSESDKKIIKLQKDAESYRSETVTLQKEYDQISNELMEAIQDCDDFKSKCLKYESDINNYEEMKKNLTENIEELEKSSENIYKFLGDLNIALDSLENADIDKNVITSFAHCDLHSDAILDKIKSFKSYLTTNFATLREENQSLNADKVVLNNCIKSLNQKHSIELEKIHCHISKLASSMSEQDLDHELTSEYLTHIIESAIHKINLTEKHNDGVESNGTQTLVSEQDNPQCQKELDILYDQTEQLGSSLTELCGSQINHLNKITHLENTLSEQLNEKETEINKLLEENNKLDSEKSHLESEISKLKKEIENLHSSINAAEQKLSEEHQNKNYLCNRLDVIIRDLEDRLEHMAIDYQRRNEQDDLSSIQSMQKEMATHALREADLERDLEYIKGKCFQLEEELKFTLTSRDEVIATNKCFEQQVLELNNTVEQKSIECQQLEKKYSEAESTMSALEKEVTESNEKFNKIELQKVELEEQLKSKTIELEKLTENLSIKCKELSELEHKCCSLSTRIDELLKEKDEIMQEKHELHIECDSLKHTLEEIQNEKGELDGTHQFQLKNFNLKKEFEDLKISFCMQNAELEELKTKYNEETLNRSHETFNHSDALMDALEEKDNTISENKKLVEQVEEAIGNYKQRHSNEIRDLEAKHNQELETYNKNIKELEELKDRASEENRKLKEEINKLQISLSNKTKELTELQLLYDETYSNIGIMSQKLEEKSNELMEMKNCITELTLQLNEVKIKYERDLNETNDNANEQPHGMLPQKETVDEENCKLMDEAKQMKKTIEELTEKCKSINASYDDACEKVKIYEQKALAQNNALEENAKLTQEIEHMTKCVEEITEKFKQLNATYEDECKKAKGYEQDIERRDEIILANLKLAEEIEEMRRVIEDQAEKQADLHTVYEIECNKVKRYEQDVIQKSEEILRLENFISETKDELVKRTEFVQQKNVELLEKVKTLEDDILKREEEVLQLQTKYEEVCKKLSDKEENFSKSEQQFDEVRVEYEQLKAIYDKLVAEDQNQKEELKMKIDEFSQKEIAYQTNQTELNNKIQDLEQCLTTEKGNLCKLTSEHETELEKKTKIISELTNKYNALDNELNLVLEENKKMTETIKELKDELKVWKTNTETLSTELEASRKKYEEATTKVTFIVNEELETKRNIEELTEKLRLATEEQQKLSAEKETLTLALAASQKALETLKATQSKELEDLQNAIKLQSLQATEQLNKICLEKENLLDEIQQLKLSITKKSEEYSKLEQTYKNILQKVTNAEDQLSTKCKELLELEGNYKSLSDQLETALTEKQNKSSSAMKLKEQVEHLTNQLERAKIKVEEQNKSIQSEFNEQIGSLKVKHSEELQNLLGKSKMEINGLHAKYQEEIIALKAAHDRDFTALNLKYQEICAINNGLNEQIKDLSSQINSLKGALDNLTAQKNLFEIENKNYVFLQSQLQNENVKLHKEIRQVNENYQDLNKKFELSMQSLKEYEPEKMKLEEKVHYLTEKNIEFAKQIEVLNDEKTKIETKLNTHANTIQFDVIRCEAEKKNLENKVMTLDTKLRQNETQKLLLSNKIEALELEKSEMKKLLDDKVKQLTSIANSTLGKSKLDNNHLSPERCSTSTSRNDDSHLSKVKSNSPTSEEIRRNSLIDRKTKRRSKHDEKRQSLWENTRDVSTMTMPTSSLCSCEELSAKVSELKRAIRIKECQINTLMLEARHNPLKEENKELLKRLSEDETEKQNLRSEIDKLKTRSVTFAENNYCTKCANRSSCTYTNKLCQTDKVYMTQSNRDEEISELKQKCDTLLEEVSKLKINNDDLKKICRLRLSRIHDLEGKFKNEKENECLNQDSSTSNHLSILKSTIESLKKDLNLITKKYQVTKALCVSRAEKIAELEKKIEEKGAS